MRLDDAAASMADTGTRFRVTSPQEVAISHHHHLPPAHHTYEPY